MSVEEIRELCRRALLDGPQKRDLASIDELFSPTMAEHAKTGAEHWHRATPDLRYTIEDIIVEGNKGVVSWTCVSTHTGELWGIAPTGKRLATAGFLSCASRMASSWREVVIGMPWKR